MTNKHIDDILRSSPQETSPALLANIAASMSANLGPVRPLPPAWVLTVLVVTLCGIVPAIAAAVLGFQGIRQFGPRRESDGFSVC